MAGAKASAWSLNMNKEVWEHNGHSSLSEGLDLKAVLSTQKVWAKGEGLNPYPTQ